jgi:hypothetical protein
VKTSEPISLDHYEFVPVEEAAKPIPGIVCCFLDCWWTVDEQGRIAFYYGGRKDRRGGGAPQCNQDERISRMFSKKDSWAVDVVQIPVVFRRVNISDYQY